MDTVIVKSVSIESFEKKKSNNYNKRNVHLNEY